MAKISIQLIKEDILSGFSNNPYWCPVALAIRRVLPNNYVKVEVGSFYINLYNGNTVQSFALSSQICDFIKLYDSCANSYDMTKSIPAAFEIDLDHPAMIYETIQK